MKKVPCCGPGCADHRVHWCAPDTPRGVQLVEVADDWNRPAFCSMTCAILGGYMKVSCDNPCPRCKAEGITVEHGDGYKCSEPEGK